MKSCNSCGNLILFGGKSNGRLTFCGEKCLSAGSLLIAAERLPNGEVAQHTHEVHQGQCPKCKKGGPIDVHTAYRIMSAGTVSTWKSIDNVCCRTCGIKSQSFNLIISFLLGWWSLHGILMTPVQVLRNIGGLIYGVDPRAPSKNLESKVRLMLASEQMAKNG